MTQTKDTKKIGKLRKIIRDLYPTYIYDKVENIPYDLIKDQNIKLLIFDMDNTLIDNRSRAMPRSCTYVIKNTTKDECSKLYWIFKRKKYTNDF